MNHLLVFDLEEVEIQEFLVLSQLVYDEREFALMEVFGDDALAHAVFDVEDIVGDLEGNTNEVHAFSYQSYGFFV